MIKGLPERIQQQRNKYGFSQRQVAEKIGVSPSVVSGYETGERTPSTEVLLSLSYLFQCSTDYLLGRQTAVPNAVINAEGLTDKQIQAIYSLIDSIREHENRL